MKILHVETGRHLYGGPQQVIYLMAALRDRGHDCTLVCPPGSGIDAAARELGLPVRGLFCAGDLDLPFAYRLAQYIRESKPDIVHCHSRRGADVLGGLAASFADVPAVVSRRVDNTEMRLIAALRYRPFKKVIAISEAIREVLLERGVEADRLKVIRSAVDADRFAVKPDCAAFRTEFDIKDDTIAIAAVGQLIPRKGHRYLLEAVADLRKRQQKFKLIIFGEGYLSGQLQAQASTLGIGDCVAFAGFREDLDDYVGCFDVLVHPALAEGLGVATLKAQAAGVPVVGFAAGGLNEAVEHGKSGYLVTPEDVEALAGSIERMISDGSLRQKFGQAGRERMQKEFSIATMADRHIEVYETVLNG
jgi:glycosyltransferase involved in cell wall biosynthesis